MKRTMIGAAVLAGLGLALGACTSTSGPRQVTSGRDATSNVHARRRLRRRPLRLRAPSPAASSSSRAPSAREAGEGPLELFTRLTGASAFAQAAGSSEYDQEGRIPRTRHIADQRRRAGGPPGHRLPERPQGRHDARVRHGPRLPEMGHRARPERAVRVSRKPGRGEDRLTTWRSKIQSS